MRSAGVRPHSSSYAFTIVEVLVVVIVLGIVAMVAVPSLTHARDTSRRADCTGNLRQVGFALVGYANLANDAVPLGYIGEQKQFNYLLNFNAHMPSQGHVTYPTLFGALWVNQLIVEPRSFYCPANTMPQHTFRGGGDPHAPNPWPPAQADVLRDAHTTVGYGLRPVVSWPLLTSSQSTPPTPAHLPSLKTLRDTAIASDILATPDHIDRAHATGINVLYGDLSASFVPREKFDVYHLRIASNSFDDDTLEKNKLLLDDSVIPHKGVWPTLDR